MVEEIPLFPLRDPLFPQVALRLQIFEQRYLSLVSESLRNRSGFAVVPISEGSEVGKPPSIYPLGTLVTIRDWSQLDNGLLGIVVEGDRRIRVISTRIRDDGLMLATVQLFEPDSVESLGQNYRDLLHLNNELARYAGAEHFRVADDSDTARLGWRLASLLPLAVEQKLELLAMEGADARLDQLRQWLLAMANK